MKTLEEIREQVEIQASKSNLSGPVITALSNLLAYTIYENQVTQTRIALEQNFNTSTLLNSRIHHAANLLYSVPRGNCPVALASGFTPMKTGQANNLDYCTSYNGYEFYFSGQYTFSTDPLDVELLITTKRVDKSITPLAEDIYVDFVDENISENIALYSGSNNYSQLKLTNDFRLLYSQVIINEVKEYQYDLLVITIPGYGVRVIRRSNSNWSDFIGNEALTLRYLVYTEVYPDLGNMLSLPNFSAPSGTPVSIKTPSISRMESKDDIYYNALRFGQSYGTIATLYDLETAIRNFDKSIRFRIYPGINISESPDYSITTQDGFYTIVTTETINLDVILRDWLLSADFTEGKSIVGKAKRPSISDGGEDKALRITIYHSGVMESRVVDELIESYKSLIGKSVSHYQFEADIIRLGADYVNVVYDGTDETATFTINCKEYEYPDLNVVGISYVIISN